MPIFVRVRLDEYMEIGPDAGKKTMPDGQTKDAVPLVEGADINDLDSWQPHIPTLYPGECMDGDSETFHDYWSWELGGKTVFMPTFNKNKDSLEADINGTYEGLDGDPDNGERYDDYIAYTLGETKAANAVYDADSDDIDEGSEAQEDTDIKTVSETHTVKETQDAQVMTMAEWKAAGLPLGKYWVYDADGWAYWAEGLQPGEATGTLMNGINLELDPDDNWYYGIHVVGQFATRGDWGQKDSTGFYDESVGVPPLS